MPPRPPLPKMTKRERLNYMYGVEALSMVEEDLMDVMWAYQGCPPEWHTVWADRDRRCGKRIRCTVGFDADVVTFFKAMGPGYQKRMNRVLRGFMHMRLAKIAQGPDTTDWITRPEDVEERFEKRGRTQWGDYVDKRRRE